MDFYKQKLENDKCSVPSILENEKEYNVFMRCREPSL
jgi:hypothetical protein